MGLFLVFTFHLHKFSNGGAESNSADALSENPFLPWLVDLVVSGKSLAAREHAFLVDLFSSQGKGAYLSASSSSLVSSLPSTSGPLPADLSSRIQASLQAFSSRHDALGRLSSPWRRSALPRVLYDGDAMSVSDESQLSRDVSEGPPSNPAPDAPNATPAGDESTRLVMPKHFSLFEPRWMRPAPATLDTGSEELIWLNPDIIQFDFSWDHLVGMDDPLEDVKALLESACKEPLQQQHQKQLLEKLDQHSASIAQIGLTPERLPELVENNPAVAFEVLLKLMSSSQITDYLRVLVNMENTLQSMEVVNRLTTAVELPTEFIHLYISNCISSCRNLQDKFNQTRLVRLVCVFLQSLIKNKIVNAQDLFAEVQSFCLEFIKVREAASLFKLLKADDQAE